MHIVYIHVTYYYILYAHTILCAYSLHLYVYLLPIDLLLCTTAFKFCANKPYYLNDFYWYI